MAKIVFIADVHAQRSAWANRPIEGDCEFALKQFVTTCVEWGVDLAVGLGDLKERPVTRAYDDGLWLDTVRQLEAGGVPFAYVQGNHDKSNPPCLWQYPNAQHLHERVIEVGGHAVYGFDYQDADSLPAALDAVPDYATVLCCHQRWGEFMGSATNPQGFLKAIAAPNLKVVASGDLHETHLKPIGARAGAFTFASPGSPCMQSIVEDEDKYLILLDGDALTKVQLRTRPVVRSPMLMTPSELDEYLERLAHRVEEATARAAAQALPPALQTPVLHVRYSYKLDDCVRRVTRLVGDKAHLFWREQPPVVEETEAKLVAVTRGEAVTPLGLLKHVVDPEEEPAVFALVERGLSANDKDGMRAAAQEFCDAYLGGTDVDQGG